MELVESSGGSNGRSRSGPLAECLHGKGLEHVEGEVSEWRTGEDDESERAARAPEAGDGFGSRPVAKLPARESVAHLGAS